MAPAPQQDSSRFWLHKDPNFHYETIRSLGLIPYGCGDIGEQLAILPKIRPHNFEDWYREWSGLAYRVLSTVEGKEDVYSPATLRNVYFRASHYIFVADFFLHGNPCDPRLEENFRLWRKWFSKAIALLDIPGVQFTVKSGHGFDMPLIIFRAAAASGSNPRPTLLIGGGFDSNMEETYHVLGVPALERNCNVVLYEGPGQPSLIRQSKGFIHDWEKAVNPVMDFLIEHSKSDLAFIDAKKIGLVGMSLGGYLAARAAAFEPRLAAVVCYDGVYDVRTAFRKALPDCQDAWEKQDDVEFNRHFNDIELHNASTGRAWIDDQAKFSFCEKDAFKIYGRLEEFTLEGGIATNIKMPVFIGLAEADLFFPGEPEKLAEAIGGHATLFRFTEEQAAQEHCQSGALMYFNNVMLEWWASIVGH